MLCVISSAATVTRRLIENVSVRCVRTHSSCPRILIDCEEDPFEDDVQFTLLVEGVQVCTCGDLVTAFALMFVTYYIYNLSYPDAIQSTMTFFRTAFLKIEESVKKDHKVSRLMTTLLSV